MKDFHHPVEEVPGLVGELYSLVGLFEALFPGRRFTPDSPGRKHRRGHSSASLQPGATAKTQGHDARSASGALVEIKATQGSSVALREQPNTS